MQIEFPLNVYYEIDFIIEISPNVADSVSYLLQNIKRLTREHIFTQQVMTHLLWNIHWCSRGGGPFINML